MLLFLLACLVSGDVNKDGMEFHVDSSNMQVCHEVSDNSQKSSMKIAMVSEGEVVGHGSGNYFKLGKHRFVLTAAHVAMAEYDLRLMDGEEMVEAILVFTDVERDIAILVPREKLNNIKPHRWKVNSNTEIVGESVNYTGYPSGLGQVLIRGMVSAHNEDGFVMQSFALPGSSGSVVFDSRGRVLGVVSAVMLHHSQFSPFPRLQENMVFVSSADFMNKKFIKEVLKCGVE